MNKNNSLALSLVGQKFGKLTVLSINKRKKVYCICKCDCGKITQTRKDSLLNGHTKSCGCLQKDTAKKLKTKHNLVKTRIYHIWINMKRRCVSTNKYYGGRGIKICDEWLSDFMNFYNWAMANGYSDKLTIDRIDVNGNYEPSNCRWITMKKQSNNTRKNCIIEYNNEKHTISEWSDILGIKYSTFYNRVKRYGIKDKFFTNTFLIHRNKKTDVKICKRKILSHLIENAFFIVGEDTVTGTTTKR